MHQDAWGKYIASPRGRRVPAGPSPAIGWDGAPQWATITDGADTCTAGLARGQRGRPHRVGQLLRRPRRHHDPPRRASGATLGARVRARARRRRLRPAQRAEPRPPHRLRRARSAPTTRGRSTRSAPASAPATASRTRSFFETTVFGVPVPFDFTTDRNVVFEGHNYGESIGDLPIEGVFDYFQALATQYGAPLWIGEYGWFSDPPAQRPKLVRYSAQGGRAAHRGRRVVAVAPGVRRPAQHRAPRRHARRRSSSTSSATAAPATTTSASCPSGRARGAPTRARSPAGSGRSTSVCDGPLEFTASTRTPGDGRGLVPRPGPSDRHRHEHRRRSTSVRCPAAGSCGSPARGRTRRASRRDPR